MASKTLAEQIDSDFLTCKICDGRLNQPKQLPCLHSFCKACISQWLGDSREATSYQCPVCRLPWALPTKGLQDLPDNTFINNLRDVIDAEKASIGEGELICSCCDKTACKRCVNCAQFLCNDCVKSHAKLSYTRNHHIVTIEQFCINDNGAIRPDRPMCLKHNSEIELYCQTCQLPICYRCTLFEHRVPGHNHMYLKDATVQHIGGLRRLMAKVKLKLSMLRIGHVAVTELSSELHQNEEAAKKEIETHAANIVEKVKKEANRLCGDVRRKCLAKESVLKMQENELSSVIRQIDTACVYCDNMVKHGTEVEILLAKQKMEDRLVQLISIENNYEPEENSHLQFVPNTNFSRGFIGTVLSSSVPVNILRSQQPTTCMNGVDEIASQFGNNCSYVELEKEYRGCVTPDSELANIAVNSDGDIVVTDPEGHRVVIYDSKLTLKKEIRFKQFSSHFSPCGVSFSKDGKLVISDTPNSQIVITDIEGNIISCHSNEKIKYPEGLVVCPDGQVHVIDRGTLGKHCIHTVTLDGQHIRTLIGKELERGEFEFPSSVAINSNKDVILADSGNDRVLVFDATFSYQFAFGCYGDRDGQFSWVTGIAVDGEGNIYVCDSNNRRIQVFCSDGKFLYCVVTTSDGLIDPRGICITQDNPQKLIVLDANTLKIFKMKNAPSHEKIQQTESECLDNTTFTSELTSQMTSTISQTTDDTESVYSDRTTTSGDSKEFDNLGEVLQQDDITML
ncbi:E3 ubiquitin-protein ligase TRIM45-like [Saccoglossus kowalevskii]|uniref:Tripartite motif-containing protein 2-like n=1 Tax=Saccoglossus kowalevskii TaxID=10224 RepID=A0ABM0MSB3_SACKO|nr:PREDICTED: tripartite motif-containing protein 2-like [Saccoglossus kowalevskii]